MNQEKGAAGKDRRQKSKIKPPQTKQKNKNPQHRTFQRRNDKSESAGACHWRRTGNGGHSRTEAATDVKGGANFDDAEEAGSQNG